MKSSVHVLFLLLLMGFPFIHQGQVIITKSDMPSPGDTLRVSLTNVVPVDYAKSGRDTAWNFSMLEAINQRVDTFVNILATPLVYQFFFIPDVVSNLASPKGLSSFFPGFPVNQFYTFYKNSNDAFVDAGFAFSIGGLPLTAKYDLPDTYYSFPLDTASSWASSSHVSISIPGMFYFASHRNRNSFADGWGSLETPYGTFETIRVRSDLLQFDSLYVDSLGFGFGLNRNITEYKWLTSGMGVPVLQVNQEGALVTAIYRDSTRFSSIPLTVSIGPDTMVTKGAIVTMHAHIEGGTPPYRVFWSTLDTTASLSVTLDTTTTFGVVVLDGLNTMAMDQRLITVVMPGINETTLQPLQLYPNPAKDAVYITLPASFSGGTLTLHNPMGQTRSTITLQQYLTTFTLDLSNTPPGLYYLHLHSNSSQYIAKLIIY